MRQLNGKDKQYNDKNYFDIEHSCVAKDTRAHVINVLENVYILDDINLNEGRRVVELKHLADQLFL